MGTPTFYHKQVDVFGVPTFFGLTKNQCNPGGKDLKVYLDDGRHAPPGWVHVKTVKEALSLLRAGGVTQIRQVNHPHCLHFGHIGLLHMQHLKAKSRLNEE